MLIVVAYGMDVEGALAGGGQGHGRRTSGVGLGELLAQLQDGRYHRLAVTLIQHTDQQSTSLS